MRNVATAVYRPKNGESQSVTVSGTSAASSAAFADQTRVVVVECSCGAHINFGASPTATTADFHILASIPYAFIVDPGQKIAAIQDAAAAGGTLYVSEVTW